MTQPAVRLPDRQSLWTVSEVSSRNNNKPAHLQAGFAQTVPSSAQHTAMELGPSLPSFPEISTDWGRLASNQTRHTRDSQLLQKPPPRRGQPPTPPAF